MKLYTTGNGILHKRNVLLAMVAVVLMALTIFINGLYERLSVVNFLASHSTGYYGGYSAPPDAEWYTIDNSQFGIDSTGGNARATTDGINQALIWAKEQGYSYVRFPQGTYMVQCNWQNRYVAPTDGILVPSGLTLDLGESIFMIEPNSYPEYTIFGIVSQSEIVILGGTLVGDKEKHMYGYNQNSPTHEFGFGICVSASSNIVIQGVTIRDMTGDGIILEGSYTAIADGGAQSSRVRILGCDISDCRRQGISVVGAADSEIAGNRIFGINGVNPQFGIDVEPELDFIVDNLMIHDNVIAGCTGGAISCHSGSNYLVFNNDCQGHLFAVKSKNVEIYSNTIERGLLRVYPNASEIELSDNLIGPGARQMIDKKTAG